LLLAIGLLELLLVCMLLLLLLLLIGDTATATATNTTTADVATGITAGPAYLALVLVVGVAVRGHVLLDHFRGALVHHCAVL
jgi:hypothetical protein